MAGRCLLPQPSPPAYRDHRGFIYKQLDPRLTTYTRLFPEGRAARRAVPRFPACCEHHSLAAISSVAVNYARPKTTATVYSNIDHAFLKA